MLFYGVVQKIPYNSLASRTVRAPTKTWVDQRERGRPSGWTLREAVGRRIFSYRDSGKNGGESMRKSGDRTGLHTRTRHRTGVDAELAVTDGY